MGNMEIMQKLIADYEKQIGLMKFDYELQIRELKTELSLANQDLEEAEKLMTDLATQLKKAVDEVKKLRENS